MKLSKAVGWKPGERPTPTEGYDVQAFAQGLDHPRWLHALPNGDILVAETDAPQMSSAAAMCSPGSQKESCALRARVTPLRIALRF